MALRCLYAAAYLIARTRLLLPCLPLLHLHTAVRSLACHSYRHLPHLANAAFPPPAGSRSTVPLHCPYPISRWRLRALATRARCPTRLRRHRPPFSRHHACKKHRTYPRQLTLSLPTLHGTLCRCTHLPASGTSNLGSSWDQVDMTTGLYLATLHFNTFLVHLHCRLFIPSLYMTSCLSCAVSGLGLATHCA